jgi:hypothetical protein
MSIMLKAIKDFLFQDAGLLLDRITHWENTLVNKARFYYLDHCVDDNYGQDNLDQKSAEETSDK